MQGHRGGLAPAAFRLDIHGRKASVQSSHGAVFQQALVSTLKKHPKHRNKGEIEVIFMMAMSQGSEGGKQSFFQKFCLEHGEQNLKELLKRCYYE